MGAGIYVLGFIATIFFRFINLHVIVAAIEPIMGAEIYSHNDCRFPEISAGASERAGFIDAPQMGPANIASNNTVVPIAMPASVPVSFEPCDTLMITSIRK